MVGLIGFVLGLTVVVVWFNRNLAVPDPDTWVAGRLIAAAYDPPESDVELYLNQGDGQIFAAQAMDPFLRNPDRLWGGPEEQAYRLQRPLYGWLGWVASAGRPDAVAWALVALTVVSTGVLAAATGWAAVRLGGAAALGLLVLVAPGVLADLLRCGPEVLGTALLAVGLGLWLGPRRRPWAAIACFAVAGLARETLLLVPVVIVASEMWDRRRGAGHPSDRGGTAESKPWLPIVAVVPYVAWVLVLRATLGAWPRGSVEGRLSLVPGGGIVEAMGSWRPDEWLAVAVTVALALAALVLGRDRRLQHLVLAHVAMALVLGAPVWYRYLDFGRVLLPLTLVSVLALSSQRPGAQAIQVAGPAAPTGEAAAAPSA